SMALEEELHWDIVQQLMDLYQENTETVKHYLDEHFTQEEQNVLEHLPHIGDNDRRVEEWMKLIKKVKANLDQDPTSEIAQSLAKEWMDRVNTMFGDNEKLRDKSWNEIKNDDGPISNYPMEPDVVEFIEKAVTELYKK